LKQKNMLTKSNHDTIRSLLEKKHVEWSSNLADQFTKLWEDPQIQNVFYTRGDLGGLPDSAKFRFDRLKNMMDPKWVPDLSDWVALKEISENIREYFLKYEKLHFSISKVKQEILFKFRWSHFLEGASVIVFCIDASHCCDVIWMEKNLLVFERMLRSDWIGNPILILLFNKRDIFEEKIARSDFKNYYPEFQGGKQTEFIEKKFLGRMSRKRIVYTLWTSALSKICIEHILQLIEGHQSFANI